MVSQLKKIVFLSLTLLSNHTERISISNTSSGIKNVSTDCLENFWKYLETIMGTELSFSGDRTSEYCLSKDSKIVFSISAVAYKRKEIPLQILD